MPFVRVTKSTMGSSGPLVDEVRMGWHLASKTVSTRSVYIALSRSVVNKLGWTIIEEGEGKEGRVSCRVAFMEGTLDDAGFVMLAEHDGRDAYRIGNNKGSSVNTSFSLGIVQSRFKHYVINEPTQEVPPAPVEFTIDETEHTLLIECPNWLRYNPASITNEMISEQIAPGYRPPPVQEPEPPELPRAAKEVKTPTQRPPTLKLPSIREVAMDRLRVVAETDEGKELKLNRTQRRKIASKVAQTLR